MEYLFVYLLQLADVWEDMIFLFVFVSITSIILTGFAFGFLIQENVSPIVENNEEDCDKFICKVFHGIKNTAIISAILALVGAFVPTKQTLLLLGGTYLAKRTVSSSIVNDKLEKINTVIDLQLDKYIKELKEGHDE